MESKKVIILRSTSIYEDSRTFKLATMLVEFGLDVTILGWDRKLEHKSEEIVKLNNGEFKIRFFQQKCTYGGGLKNLYKMIKYQKWLKKQVLTFPRGSIIHACDYDTAKSIYKIAAKKYKLVYDIFDFYSDTHKLPKILANLIRKDELKIINQSNTTIICTEQRIEQIKGSSPNNLVVIHNTPSFNKNFSKCKQNKRLKICFIGALTPDRLLLEIINDIHKYPQYDFVFGGLGCYEENIKQVVNNLDNVVYLGKMPYAEVLEVENKCDVLFATYNPKIPNHKYSAPNKFYEAGCLSKPVIVCKDTGIDKLVKEYNTGLCIEYTSKDFFDKLSLLDKNRKLLKELGENGNKAYNEHFSSDIMKKRIRELYKNLTK